MKLSRCKSCDEYIVWMKTEAGKNMPVGADSVDEDDELVFDSNKHISHFATCPNANQHRRAT